MVPQAVFSQSATAGLPRGAPVASGALHRDREPAPAPEPCASPPNPIEGRTGITVLKIREQCTSTSRRRKGVRRCPGGRKPTVRQAILLESYRSASIRRRGVSATGYPLEFRVAHLRRGVRARPDRRAIGMRAVGIRAPQTCEIVSARHERRRAVCAGDLELLDGRPRFRLRRVRSRVGSVAGDAAAIRA